MYGNPYFNQQQRFQPMNIPNQPVINQQYIPPMQTLQQPTTQIGLLGKSVDSVDVVKAMDIPLDGSVSYFPLTDGSAIVTKQLQTDGTSKTIVYKPIDDPKEDKVKYVTFNELEDLIPKIDVSEIEEMMEDFKSIKKQIKELKDKISK